MSWVCRESAGKKLEKEVERQKELVSESENVINSALDDVFSFV